MYKFSLFTLTMQSHFRLLDSFFHFHNEYIFTIKTSPVRWYSAWFFPNISLRNAVRRKILYDSNKKSNKIIQTMKNYKTMAFLNSRYKYQFLNSLFTILIHAKFRIQFFKHPTHREFFNLSWLKIKKIDETGYRIAGRRSAGNRDSYIWSYICPSIWTSDQRKKAI